MELETPFAQVLDTNYAPSAPERDKLRSLIQNPEETILKLDEEIQRLQAKRKQLQRFVDRHRALLSPFRRLPADVWRTIFFGCLPSNKLGLCTRTMKEAPLLLTTICRSWREIAHSTPSLWNSVHIFIPCPSRFMGETYVLDMRARIDGFRNWLNRSGSLPITISVTSQEYEVLFRSHTHITQPDSNWRQELMEVYQTLQREFTELLAQYSRRWRTLAFGYPPLDLSPLERLTPEDLRWLQDVHSYDTLFPFQDDWGAVPLGSSPADLSSLANLLSRSSSLRTLRLVSERISERTLSFPIGWSRLTELSISSISAHLSTPSLIINMLARQCHSLITLSLEINYIGHEDGDVLPPPIEWPSLHSLSLTFECHWFNFDRNMPTQAPTFLAAVTNTFNTVICPSLTRLSVFLNGRNHFDQPIFDATPFDGLLMTSQCPLVHLEISCPQYFTLQALLRVLRPLDSLMSLDLGHGTRLGYSQRHIGDVPSDRSHRWCSELLQATDPERLFPELEDVNVRGCYVDEVDVILCFAKQRPRLRALRAGFGRLTPREVKQLLESREEMNMLREKGVELSWAYTEVDTRQKPNDNGNDGMPGLNSWW